MRGYIHSDTTITERELQVIDPATGHVTSVLPLALPPSPAGSSTSFPLPPQIAFVVTLRSALAGASGRGRFYVPSLTSTNLTAQGRASNAMRDAFADATAGYATIMFTETGTPRMVVFSRKGLFSTSVTSVDAGNVFDTQRRRRNKMVEARHSATV